MPYLCNDSKLVLAEFWAACNHFKDIGGFLKSQTPPRVQVLEFGCLPDAKASHIITKVARRTTWGVEIATCIIDYIVYRIQDSIWRKIADSPLLGCMYMSGEVCGLCLSFCLSVSCVECCHCCKRASQLSVRRAKQQPNNKRHGMP